MVTKPSSPSSGPDAAATAAARAAACWAEIQGHFTSRPKATGLSTVPLRASDVMVTTFPKSGTTLMQNLTYQVVALSGGGPPFDPTGLHFPDLAVVSPWVDYIPQIGIPPCETTPRILKTHSSVAAFNPANPCRHIVVMRDPVAYPASFLDFCFNALVRDADAVPADVRQEVFNHCAREGITEPHVKHAHAAQYADNGPSGAGKGAGAGAEDADDALSRWHKFAKDSVLPLRENVLVLFYEDVVRDLPGTARKVAAFIGCKVTDGMVDEVVRRCDRSAMAGDPRFFCRIENKCWGLGPPTPKVSTQTKGSFKCFKVGDDILRKVEAMNMHVFGTPKYADVREMITKKQWELFRR